MFTGIVESTASVLDVYGRPDAKRMHLELPEESTKGLERGASIGVDGVCLTVTEIEGRRVALDVIRSTLQRTTLGDIEAGDALNFERSLRLHAEIGGHEVSGHVDTTATVTAVETPPGNVRVEFAVEPDWTRYLFPRGFVALAGASLTVGAVDRRAGRFDVWLIPETLRRTNLSRLEVGACVNLEILRGVQVVVDSVSDAVNRFLERALRSDSFDPERFAALVDSLRRSGLGSGDAGDVGGDAEQD